MKWIRSTFLYIRAAKNPTSYNYPANMTKAELEMKLENTATIALNALERYHLIKRNTCNIQSTVYGRLMSKFYVSLETMKLFQKIKGSETMEDLLKILIQSEEFNDCKLRVNEKRPLNTLNQNSDKEGPLRFPIKGKIKTVANKLSW